MKPSLPYRGPGSFHVSTPCLAVLKGYQKESQHFERSNLDTPNVEQTGVPKKGPTRASWFNWGGFLADTSCFRGLTDLESFWFKPRRNPQGTPFRAACVSLARVCPPLPAKTDRVIQWYLKHGTVETLAESWTSFWAFMSTTYPNSKVRPLFQAGDFRMYPLLQIPAFLKISFGKPIGFPGYLPPFLVEG